VCSSDLCLLFQMANGESVPLSAEMISIELGGDTATKFDPHFVQHAANAVFHYFKHDLGRLTVTVGEFAGALENVLRGFGASAEAVARKTSAPPRLVESDLRDLASQSGQGCELFFFPKLRDEMRHQLERTPQIVRFRGLRSCVKQLTGKQRWCPRCQTLHDQIVEFLRNCFTAHASRPGCALLVDS
jgi:hypothetical protein